jgi:hypothetical protein
MPELIHLAWPVVTLVIILLFREPIAKVLESLADWRQIKVSKDNIELVRQEVAEIKSRVDRIEAATLSGGSPGIGTPGLKENPPSADTK